MRVEVKLSDLLPNPFQEQVYGKDWRKPSIIEALKASMAATSVWEQWVVREAPGKPGKYQMAFGHHRHRAAWELKGTNYKVSVQVEKFTDAQMLQALAMENENRRAKDAEEGDTTLQDRITLVHIASEFLKANPDKCQNPNRKSKASTSYGCHKGNHGGEHCVGAFLRWAPTSVGHLLRMKEKLAPEVLNLISTDQDRSATVLGRNVATKLTLIGQSAQKEAVRVIKKASVSVSPKVVKEAVDKVRSLPESEQPKAMKRELESAIREKKDAEKIAKRWAGRREEPKGQKQFDEKPDVGGFIIDLGFSDRERLKKLEAKMEAVFAVRSELHGEELQDLLEALERGADFYNKWLKLFRSKPQKALAAAGK
jgi:hypothetical protein